MKKLIPAMCLLLISALLLGTSTYAWFSMNTAVTATGMQVKAQAESGIVISNANQETWNASASAKDTAVAELLPTSTSNFTKWYHSTSADAKDANAHQTATGAYTEVSNGTSKYYSENVFYIKSATANALVKTLYIKSVTVTGADATHYLDKTLRVGIKMSTSETIMIFAPVSGATLTYYCNGSTSVSAIDSSSSATTAINTNTGVTSIPASDNGLKATVYVWFEGEDAACISDNVTSTLDTITVTVQFTTDVPTTD